MELENNEFLVDSSQINQLYQKGEIDSPSSYTENTFLVASDGVKNEVPVIYQDGKLKKIDRNIMFMGIEPRNNQQLACMHMLKDGSIASVAITGMARSGKSLFATDYGLHSVRNGDYDKLILTRPNIELGDSMGFLPGEKEQKFKPYLQPVYDCAESLGDRDMIDDMLSKGMIDAIPIPYMKGRNFKNSIIIVDEAEDLTIEVLQILGTRLDEGSKIIFTGDIEQIDNRKVKGNMSPFQYMVKKFKHSRITSHIHFTENQGSPIVNLFYHDLDRNDFKHGKYVGKEF
jgi:PhoH-like ATPase